MSATAAPARSRARPWLARSAAPRTVDHIGSYLLLVPATIYIALFFAYPLAHNVWMAFLDYTTKSFYTGEAPWIGLANYAATLGSGSFGSLVLHTVLFVAGSIVGQFTLGLALAVFFNRNFRLNGLLRSLLLLPWLLPLVVSGTVFRWMLDADNGVINQLIAAMGLPTVPWLVSTQTALLAVIGVNIWVGIPFNMVILYGGLKEIPVETHEAARIDGATARQTFIRITLPQLKPVVTVVLVLGFVYTIKVLDLILVLTHGGPANSTQTLAMEAYRLSFETFNFGQGAAVSNVLIMISLICAFLYLRVSRTKE